MDNKIRNIIQDKAILEFKSIPDNIQSGEREVQQDLILMKLCESIGYTLSEFYGCDLKKLYCFN